MLPSRICGVDFWIKGIGESSAQVAVDGVAEASGYLFYHSLDGVNFDGGTFSSSPVYTATNLSPEVPHYFRVRAVNAAGQSALTEVLGVSTSVWPGTNQLLIVNAFDRTSGIAGTDFFGLGQIAFDNGTHGGYDGDYPNPFNPQTTLTYRLSKAEQVRAALHNVLGREVKLIFDEWQTTGEHRRQVNLVGLPSGVYFLRLQSGKEVRVQKWLLQK